MTHRLFDEELCAFCSPSLTEGPSGIRRFEDLEKVTLLRWDLSQFEGTSSTRKWNDWNYWLSQVGAEHINPGEGLRYTDYNLMVQAAIAGQGVILGSRPELRNLVEANLLVAAVPQVAVTDIGYDLVTTNQALTRTEVASFLDWIVEIARGRRGQPEPSAVRSPRPSASAARKAAVSP